MSLSIYFGPNYVQSSLPMRFGDSRNRKLVDYYPTNRDLADFISAEDYPLHAITQLKPGMNVLDIGSGAGAFVEELCKRGMKAIGVDKQKSLPKRPYLIQQAFEETNFPANMFDRIFSAYAIFRYPEPFAFKLAAFREAIRILKPGGKMYLTGLKNKSEIQAIIQKTCELDAVVLSVDNPPQAAWIEITKG